MSKIEIWINRTTSGRVASHVQAREGDLVLHVNNTSQTGDLAAIREALTTADVLKNELARRQQ